MFCELSLLLITYRKKSYGGTFFCIRQVDVDVHILALTLIKCIFNDRWTSLNLLNQIKNFFRIFGKIDVIWTKIVILHDACQRKMEHCYSFGPNMNNMQMQEEEDNWPHHNGASWADGQK